MKKNQIIISAIFFAILIISITLTALIASSGDNGRAELEEKVSSLEASNAKKSDRLKDCNETLVANQKSTLWYALALSSTAEFLTGDASKINEAVRYKDLAEESTASVETSQYENCRGEK